MPLQPSLLVRNCPPKRVNSTLAFRSSSLKDGDYPRGRLIVMAATGLSMLLLGLFLRVFAKGSVVGWAAYFVGIALLLVVSAVQFTRSSGPEVS